MRFLQSKEERRAAADARAEYEHFLGVLREGSPQTVREEALALKRDGVAALPAHERNKLGLQVFHAYADAVLADEVLTEGEEETFFDVCEAVGITDEHWQHDRDLFFRLAIAKLNDGRLATIDEPHLMTKKNEVVHLETAAGLMKEVTLREFRGGTSGFSFPETKGVRYRVGAFRGHSVVVGTKLRSRTRGCSR